MFDELSKKINAYNLDIVIKKKTKEVTCFNLLKSKRQCPCNIECSPE